MDGRRSFTGELVGASDDEVTIAADTGVIHPVRRHPPIELAGGLTAMSQEILDAMTALAREKGIAPDKLRHALEDALLSAYKKQPGSAKYARVELDRDRGLPRRLGAASCPSASRRT